MAGRNKEVSVILLDVGPKMHPHLDLASRAVMDFLQSKMLSKPAHESSLVFFGTTGTLNNLNTEMESSGDPGQYLHITVRHPLEPPTLDYMRSLKTVPRGEGVSDFVDTLTVALDSLYRVINTRPDLLKNTVVKRIVLVSNFLTAAKEDPDDVFIPVLIDRMREQGMQFDVISLDVAAEDDKHLEAKTFNSNLVARIGSEVTHTLTSVQHPADLAGVFKSKEYGHTAYYSGSLMIGEGMAIKVKVCKKTSQERFPSLGKQSPLQEPGASWDEGFLEPEQGVSPAKQYVKVQDPDVIVSDGEVTKAWRYGKELVPLNAEEEELLRYSPDKGLWLVGVVDGDRIPRHHYMKDCWCVVADKADIDRSGRALGALVQALHLKGRRAVLRFVPRKGGAVDLCVGTPMPASGSRPDWLLLNHLPFLEDVRNFPFASLDKAARQPRQEQLEATRRLVQTMSLGEGIREQLPPEHTVNPTLHAFYHAMTERALDPGAAMPVQDPLVERVLRPRVADMAGAQEALEGAKAAFPTGPGRRGKGSVVEEFEDMVERGGPTKAFDFVRVKLIELTSSGREEWMEEAADVLQAFRDASVAKGKWEPFNAFYQNISRSARDPTRRPFWRRIVERRLRLIDSGDLPESNASQRQADELFNDIAAKQEG